MHITTFNKSYRKGGVWGTSYHLALVELESHVLLASLSLSLSLSLSSLSPVPCPAGVARWYGVLGLGAKLRTRMCWVRDAGFQRFSHEGRSVAGAGR